MEPGTWYTPDELTDLPTLAEGQADTQVGETNRTGPGSQRVWISRVEHGMVSVETLDDTLGDTYYYWVTTYEGYPTAIRINWTDTVEVNENAQRTASDR